MPPRKRASSGSGAQPREPKNAKANNDNNDEETPQETQPRSKRWTTTCVSANLDADFTEAITKGRDSAFSYICFCPPHQLKDDEDEGEPLSPEDASEDSVETTKYHCDNGETCLCDKPAADHPEHTWTITKAGMRKLSNIHTHATLRCPDLFDMYIYNDFEGYGLVEVMQNIVLDFVEAEGDWKEQWAICEATAHFIMDDNAFMPMTTIDDGDQANDTYCLIGGLFLTMLAKLEPEGLLGPDSEVKNLGTIMASYIETTVGMRDYGIADDRGDDKDKITKFHNSDAYILAYAKKHNIHLYGPPKIDSCVEDLDEVKLPKTSKNDPWDGTAAVKEYEKRYGKPMNPKIGGNEFDITAMTSDERKKKNFGKKDPLGKAERDAIKQGMIMQLA